MHHKCVKCGKVYEHASEEILSGCICGSKLFYFVKNGLNAPLKKTVMTNAGDVDEVEYFYELDDETNHELIAFDIEAVRVKSSGKYEIDLNSLMNNNGLIYSYGEGKYSVDIDSNMKQLKKKR